MGAGGRGFESRYPDNKKATIKDGCLFVFINFADFDGLGIKDQRKKLRDLGYAYNLHTLNKKKALSITPLNTLLKALIFAFKDSLAALVALL